MARNPRLAAVRRALLTRRTGWGLAAALVLLGILLGWHQLTRAVSMVGQSLAEAGRLMLDAGWPLLLLTAAVLVLGLAFSSPRRAAFPAALILVATGLGLWGRLLLVSSTPTPPPLDNQGYIMVYTTDPKARVSLTILPSFDSPQKDVYVSSAEEVTLGLRFESSAEGPQVWAVALGGDAQFHPGELPASSGELPEHYVDDWRSYFATGADWPPGSQFSPDGTLIDGTVIFGDPGNLNAVDQILFIHMREPLLKDVGEYVTLNTPTFGRPGSTRDPQPIWFFSEDTDDQIEAKVNQYRWYEPERLQLHFDGERYTQLKEARQEAGTAPVAPLRKEWRAEGTLQVQASFARPSEATKNERWVFFAGVLVSLAASLFVWALELLLGPRRDPVAAPRRRP